MEIKIEEENFTIDNEIQEKISAIKDYESKFLIHTEGSHSVRYDSITFVDNETIIYPCGIYLNKFSITKNKIEKTLFIENSIIFNVQKKENFIITVCYNGKGALIDLANFSISKIFEFKYANAVSNVSFTNDFSAIVVSAEYYKNKDSDNVKIFNGACGILVKNKNEGFQLMEVIKRNDCLAEINCDNNLVLIEKVFAEQLENSEELENNKDFYYKFSLINLNIYLKDIKDYSLDEKVKEEISIKKPILEDYLITRKKFFKNEEISFLLKSESKQLIGISFYKRNLLFLNIKSLEAILSVEFEGKGFLGGMDFKDNKLYFANKARTIVSMDLESFMVNSEKNDGFEISKDEVFEKKCDYLKVYLNNKISLNKQKNDYEISDYLLKELIINVPLVHSLNYCLRISSDGKTICWVNESGLHIYSNTLSEDAVCITRNSPIKMTGVGLSISKNADYFAVGDLEGNINIYKICNKHSSETKSQLVINISTLGTFDSIRCLEWSEDDDLYIGCMSGKLFQVRKSQQNSEILYKENRENFEINLLDDFHCTITCIRIHSLYLDTHSESLVSNINFEASNNENFLDLKKNSYKIIKNFIFLSTTKGSISILYNCNQGFLRLNEFLAHPPQPENRDLRFGSLKFKAEVWSIALKEKYKNISENKLILNIFSASEDQMVKIWELNLFDLLNHKEIIKGICVGNKVKLEQNPIEKIKKILNVEEIKACKNHSLAVTSVDCKIVKIQNAEKHILATCSDDKLINIYDADDNNEFNFIANLSTKNHVVGWHTITYLSLEENGHRLAVVTQNGFLVIFSLLDFSVLFCEKIHLGGIEGLSWKKNTIITCSSDLNLGIINLP